MLAGQRCDPAEAVLIAAHDWDIAGAAAAGLRTAVTVTGAGLDAVATELIEANR